MTCLQRTFLFISAFILIGSSPVHAVQERYELLELAETALLNDRFELARDFLDSLIQMEPDHPIGYVYKAAAFLAEMTDAEEKRYPDSFMVLIDTVFSLTENPPDLLPATDKALYQLCRGHAYAYQSLWESRFGSTPSAISNGFKAKGAYEKGLAYDSTWFDLYGGLGMYHYWKSAKAGLLRWIGIFKNDKERGINELYLTLDSSRFSQTTARNALLWIYLDKKEYDSAIVISNELIERYPEGKLFLWPLAKAYEGNGEYKSALNTYRQLLQRLQSVPGNYYNRIEVDYRICLLLIETDRKQTAIEHAKSIYEYVHNVKRPIRHRQKNKIQFLVKLSKR